MFFFYLRSTRTKLAVGLCLLLASAAAAQPLRVHPDNPRYLIDGDGNTVLLTGSHTWSLLQDLEHNGKRLRPRYGGHLQWLRLLDDWGHNFTRGWLWEDGYYSPLPYAKNGSGYDLEAWNFAFFDRLYRRARAADRRDTFLGVMLFQGWSVNAKRGGSGKPYRLPDPWARHPLKSTANAPGKDGRQVHEAGGELLRLQKRYVTQMVDTLNGFDHIVWEIANEAHFGSLNWQKQIAAFIRETEATLPNQHLVWISCASSGGAAAANESLLASGADLVSPCGRSTPAYLGDPPTPPPGGPVVIADSDHIFPERVRYDWAWKSFLRGLHPIYMDLRSDRLPWYRGNLESLSRRDTRRMRRALGTIQRLAGEIDLAAMAPQRRASADPIKHLGGVKNFALFSSAAPASADPSPDGREFVAFEPEGGGVLRVCDLQAGRPYRVRWLHPVTGKVRSDSRVTARRPCRTFQNPRPRGASVLHLRMGDGAQTGGSGE